MTRMITLAALAMSLNALAQNTTVPGTTTADGGDTPTTVCKSLIESAQNKDFEGFMKWSTGMERHRGKGIKGKFAKMNEKYFDKLQGLSCMTEHVANDRAFVEAEAQGEKRFVPFIKTEAGWKFDAKTYKAFYNYPRKRSKKM